MKAPCERSRRSTRRAVELKGDYQLTFNALGRDHYIKVGGLARQTSRDADTRAYSISAPGAGANVVALDPEQIFDGRFTNPSRQRLLPRAAGAGWIVRRAATTSPQAT